ncbi:alpha-L-rhamnosidase-related protein [Agromyces kandeliae]|uniref:Bacterial alpha-L-rhamnosidase n=1 Tax=Agromyces kandeliae TaxID=2666141 RepID=A0A6L5R682_9MICO|nr:family 78 glycoside hydrolase catalytic domain [Agromyces kandeliae]MRX44647.1 Bacterial alpha-L-rhamnosidase [Agromyces kandeliae]
MPQQPPRSAEEVRRWVRARSPQPFEDDDVVPRAADRGWAYARDQYELALLGRLVEDGFAANRHVHYPRNHGRPVERVRFRATAAEPGRISVRVAGRAEVSARADAAGSAAPVIALVLGDDDLRFEVAAAGAVVEFDVVARPGDVPALGVPVGAPLVDWSARVGDDSWEPIVLRPGGARAPHLEGPGHVEVAAVRRPDGLYDLGAPLLGRPILPAGPEPVVGSGESLAEARADEADRETRHEVIPTEGGWTTSHPLGFRYLAVESEDVPDEIRVRADVTPVARPGAFACSDELLTRIWASAQYTLRVCDQGLMIDGIKRDRMPWAGDQALSTLANAFALGDGGVVADGLVALGRPDHGYVNGIADYSLWWVVNADLYVRYFGDLAFAEREADHVDAFVADLARFADDRGVFRPEAQRGGFVDSGPGSVFLDWGLSIEDGRDPVALQMLWCWALRSAARLLGRVEHAGAVRWRTLADRVEATLRADGWLDDTGRWADYLGADATTSSPAPYANFLSVLAGMHPDGVPDGVASSTRTGTAGTPFMTAFRLRARLEASENEAVLVEIRRIWGAMLEAGPGTFWEEASSAANDLAMYGRPFGRSLCHAWSAGPAALIPEAVLGIRPLDDGWARFEVVPRLAGLDWASAVVPTPLGDVVVHADATGSTVRIPAGASLAHGDRIDIGPAVVELDVAAAMPGVQPGSSRIG